MPRDAAFWSTDRKAPSYGRSAARLPGAAGAGSGVVQADVDVEEPGQRTGGVHPQPAGQPTAPQLPDVADGVVVEPPREPDAGRRPGQVVLEGGGDAGQLGREVAELRAEGVLGRL